MWYQFAFSNLPIRLLSNGELNFFSGVVSPDACCLAIRPCSSGDLKAVAEPPPVLAVILPDTEVDIDEAILGGSELGCWPLRSAGVGEEVFTLFMIISSFYKLFFRLYEIIKQYIRIQAEGVYYLSYTSSVMISWKQELFSLWTKSAESNQLLIMRTPSLTPQGNWQPL